MTNPRILTGLKLSSAVIALAAFAGPAFATVRGWPPGPSRLTRRSS